MLQILGPGLTDVRVCPKGWAPRWGGKKGHMKKRREEKSVWAHDREEDVHEECI